MVGSSIDWTHREVTGKGQNNSSSSSFPVPLGSCVFVRFQLFLWTGTAAAGSGVGLRVYYIGNWLCRHRTNQKTLAQMPIILDMGIKLICHSELLIHKVSISIYTVSRPPRVTISDQFNSLGEEVLSSGGTTEYFLYDKKLWFWQIKKC